MIQEILKLGADLCRLIGLFREINLRSESGMLLVKGWIMCKLEWTHVFLIAPVFFGADEERFSLLTLDTLEERDIAEDLLRTIDAHCLCRKGIFSDFESSSISWRFIM